MFAKLCAPLLGTLLLLAACTPRNSLPDGTVAIDESITLTRGAAGDSAQREFVVANDSIVVALVDEQLTDIKLKLATLDSNGKPIEAEVENNLDGAGIEIATLRVPAGARVVASLAGAPDADKPGKVSLRVKLFGSSAESKPEFAAQLTAYHAWSDATNATLRTDAIKKNGVANIDRAIASLESPHGDAALAAEARLIKASMLNTFKVDRREARLEAQRAAAAFKNLPQPDALNVARANLIEALALIEISIDSDAVNPTAAQAGQLARATLESLSASQVLGPIERARAFRALVSLDENMMMPDAAGAHIEQARALFESAGYVAGVREMRMAKANLLVMLGNFGDGAREFDALLPEIGKLKSPELRATYFIAAARAISFSGRQDEAADLLLNMLPFTRAQHLPQQEATALLELGHIYQSRADIMQATAFYDAALKLARAENLVMELIEGLQSAGFMARANGDLDRAFALHEEAVRRSSSSPVAQVRSRLDYAVDFYRKGDLTSSIRILREALAVDLNDPGSHIYTDGKLLLAQFLAEYPQSTPQELVDADRLNREARATSIRVDDQWRVIRTYRVSGQIYARAGKPAKALADFERTFTMAQDYRKRSASTEARTAMLSDEQYAYRGYLDIVLENVAKRGAGVFHSASPTELAAMRRLEHTRQENFGALRVGALDAKTSAHVDELLEKMAQRSLRIATLLRSDTSAANTTELHDLQLDMAALHAELDHVRTSAAEALPPAQEWRPLPAGMAQLSYALTDNHVYALVRSAAGTRITVLAPARKDLEDQLIAFSLLDVATKSPQIETALEQISVALMPPGLLPANTTAVEIVAEGRIASVPFPALRSPVDPKRRLIETHEVALVPSLFGVDQAPRLKQARPFRFVALASGNGTYRDAAQIDPTPRLHAATKEIKTAAALFTARDPAAKIKLLTGAEGSAAAVRDIWASGADVVHFATHALADLRQPVASLLVLPAMDANGKATYLTAGQVQGWRGDAELVFLSACESAIGPPQFAVGMPGLQRAFLRAGARGVIATLAPIEDVLAQQFAADFYQHYTNGETAQRALSETQRQWLTPQPGMSAADQLRRRVTALSHAYFAL